MILPKLCQTCSLQRHIHVVSRLLSQTAGATKKELKSSYDAIVIGAGKIILIDWFISLTLMQILQRLKVRLKGFKMKKLLSFLSWNWILHLHCVIYINKKGCVKSYSSSSTNVSSKNLWKNSPLFCF